MSFQKRAVGECPVCHGRIIEIDDVPDDPTKAPATAQVLSATERRPLHPVVARHCEDCGIQFAHPPKPQQRGIRKK